MNRRLGLAGLLVVLAVAGLASSAPGYPQRAERFIDLASPFEEVAIRTRGQPAEARVAAIRARMNSLLPGVYPPTRNTERQIADALTRFPASRSAYDQAIARFPAALHRAITHFRTTFPDFRSPIPIYLYHSLGLRDGGSDTLEPGHRRVMLFGADMIAQYHPGGSLTPFMEHELFHLEHARYFADCDQFWCTLWQEGLAVDAAAAMTPHATDYQLLLDMPKPIRGPTDAQWGDALCFVAKHFDDVDGDATVRSFQMGGRPPSGLPDRFGYYVGFRIAQAAGKRLTQLARLDNAAAHPVVRAALARLIDKANARCPST